ncbi:hypothetical protein GY26_10060 [Gammaproteobacteria bacterium MFB021]|nr:hypothetical protein GY26_10060 [Gammaproteobacteria bacterium MFB021]
MKHGLKRLCGAGALVLPLSVWAQQPVVDDLTGQSSGGFYSQTQARESGGGTLTILNELQDNRQQIQQLRGQVEELRYQLDQLKQQTQQQYLDLDDRLSGSGSGNGGDMSGSSVDTGAASQVTENSGAGDSGAAGSSAGAASATTADSGASAPAAGGSGDGRDAYQAAFQQVQARQFDAAISSFKRFIADYPQSSLIPNAHYWLGELYSAQSQLDAAATAFNTVIDDYPQSSKVPDALYKLGLLKARQGDTTGSRELLKRVQSDYPKSSAAQMAGDFLNQLGN